jgi:flagellar basal body rod protein FlgG
MTNTGNPTDLALTGQGFFAVNGPNGPLYTRNGSFQVSSQGALVTGEGYPVRLAGGQPVALDPAAQIVVGADGTISQNGAALGQLEIDSFTDPNLLQKAGGTYFQNPDPRKIGPLAATNVQVAQGKLESSNALPAESAARMVTLLRNFEMLQHAVKIGTDMNKEAIEEVARVGS